MSASTVNLSISPTPLLPYSPTPLLPRSPTILIISIQPDMILLRMALISRAITIVQ
ncbi:MAG: hypothetical protein SWX82_30605 [Cyanobacteriota bacterium]|nr:hypothetical protein [Cyanobacteriota bacterium]